MFGNVMRRQKEKPQVINDQNTKRRQKWDARVHLTRDLKQLNQHDELYQITLSKTPKNVILKKWYSPFFHPTISEKIKKLYRKQ